MQVYLVGGAVRDELLGLPVTEKDWCVVGATPEEMGENSKNHVMEMVQSCDQAHMDAIEAMKSLSPDQQMKWYEDFKKGFDALPEA